MLAKKLIYRPIFRYIVAILSGYIVDFLIYSILIKIGGPLVIANTAAFIVGVVINTILIRRYVFIDSKYNLLKDIRLSFLSSGLMFGFGMSMLWALVKFLNVNPYLAKVMTNGFTFAINYIIRKLYFRKR